MDIIEIAQECGAEISSGDWCDSDIRVYHFWQFELEAFAQRIEQPLLEQIEQLRDALSAQSDRAVAGCFA